MNLKNDIFELNDDKVDCIDETIEQHYVNIDHVDCLDVWYIWLDVKHNFYQLRNKNAIYLC